MVRLQILFLACATPLFAESAQAGDHWGVDALWVLIAAALVFLMQAGFLNLEAGMVREKNATGVAMKNVIDWVVVSIGFFVIGFGVMFGTSEAGLFGNSLFSLANIEASTGANQMSWIFFLFQLAFAGTALTIVSGAISGRTGFIPYLVGSLLMGVIIYPIFGHWAWGDTLVEGNTPWLAELGFIDFAGSTVVHSVGAWVALVGVWMVGPRLGRYNARGELQQFKPSNLSRAVMGVVILWFGWWGFNGGSSLAMSADVGRIILNTNISAACAGLASFFHSYFLQNKADLNEKFLGGLLGGLVAITAAANLVSPLGAALVGLAAGLIHNFSYDLILKKLRLDDAVGAIPVHGFCGVWGTLSVALFGDVSAFGGLTRVEQLGIQAVGVVACFAWTTTAAVVMYQVLKSTVGLRVSPGEERLGINIAGEVEEEQSVDRDELSALLNG